LFLRIIRLLMLSVVSIWATAPMFIAVNEFQVDNVSASDGRIITNRLRAELINTGAFRVLERAEMESILQEQGFQQSGACNTSTCQVQIGQLLGVDRLFAGQIGRIGDLITISVRVLNVGSGEILFTVNEDYHGPLENVLSEVVAKVAQRLAVTGSVMNGVGTGDLYIESSPSGAKVRVDGIEMKGLTPLTLQRIAVGKHQVELSLGDLAGSSLVSLPPNALQRMKIDLQKGVGSIKIFSSENGAGVVLDGEEKGETPLLIDDVPVGLHHLKLQKNGYLPEDIDLSVKVGEISTTNIALRPCATLILRVEPEKAQVYLNHAGEAVHSGEFLVPPGKIHLNVVAADFDSFEDSLDVKAGEVVNREITLRYTFGSLVVKGTPDQAWVYWDNFYMGKIPLQISRIVPGEHHLTVLAPSFDSVNRLVTLHTGQLDTVNIRLPSSYASLKVESYPDSAQVYLDSVFIGATPLDRNDILPGRHRITLKKSNFMDSLETLDFSKDSVWPLDINLHRDAASIRSLRAQARWGIRCLAGLVGVIGVYEMIAGNNDIKQSNKDMAGLRQQYSQGNLSTNYSALRNNFQVAHRDGVNGETMRNVGLGMTIGAVASIGLTFIF